MSNYSYEEALEAAKRYLANMNSEVALALQTEDTLSKDYGWVFFYNSELFLKTGNPIERLAGNAPFVVLNKSLNIIELETSLSVENSLLNLEREVVRCPIHNSEKFNK